MKKQFFLSFRMIATIAVFLLTATSALATTIRVPGDYNTIQAAVTAAAIGDTILVADGTYTGVGNRDISFNGKNITVKSENGATSCIIDCERQGRAFIFEQRKSSASTLDGLTIKNGYNSENGGAIKIDSYSTLTIRNCTFINNETDKEGGAVSGSAIFFNCTFSNNTATGYRGGAVLTYSRPALFDSCIFSNNHSGLFGGAIASYYLLDGVNTFDNCTFTNNTASRGGAINTLTSSIFKNCTFEKNTAIYGGGVRIYDSDYYHTTFTFDNCTFSENMAATQGGGIDGGNISCNNCTFEKNGFSDPELSPSRYGGAVSLNYGNSFKNCFFIDNKAQKGGAVYWHRNSESTFVNSIFLRNQAENRGGAVYSDMYTAADTPNIITNCTFTLNHADIGGTIFCYFNDGPDDNDPLLIKNSILWNNQADTSNPEIYEGGKSAVVTWSDIKGGHNGTNNIDSDPLFGNTTNAAGLYLNSSSPCINSADHNEAPNEDILGYMRPIPDGADNYDMGAYEYHADYQLVTITSDEGGTTDKDGNNTIAHNGSIIITATATAGYLFTGWSGDASGTSNPLTLNNIISNQNITANFIPNQHTVTVTPSAGGHTDKDGDNNVTLGGSITITATANPGYNFTRWSGDASGTVNPLTINSIVTDKNITAIFTPTQYTIKVSSSAGGYTDKAGNNIVDSGDSMTITATAFAGYIFSGWSGDASGTDNPLTITNIMTNQNIMANFTKSQFTVKVNSTAGGHTDKDGDNTVNRGDSITITATADTGYTFTEWSGDATGTSNPLQVNDVTTAKNITANFTANQLSVTVTPTTGGSTDKDGSNSVALNGSITILATSTAGYIFTGWGGDASGTTNPLTISNISSNKNITANFVASQYTVTVTSSAGGTTDKDGSNSVALGGSISIKATATTGYMFAAWSGDASGSLNPLNINNVAANYAITANFSIILDGIIYVCRDGICNTHAPCYDNITAAYQASANQGIIKTGEDSLIGGIVFNRDISITLTGGWNNDYSSNTEKYSKIIGSLTISAGTTTIENIVIEGEESLAMINGSGSNCKHTDSFL